jgi:hypothetical protein
MSVCALCVVVVDAVVVDAVVVAAVVVAAAVIVAVVAVAVSFAALLLSVSVWFANQHISLPCLVWQTHMMDEASILCDRVAIMTHGAVQCIGTQQEVKAQFPTAFVLTITFPPTMGDPAVRLVHSLVPDAVLDSRFRSSATFHLPKAGAVGIADVFEALLRDSAAAGITDWGIGQVTLEDVFQAVVLANRHLV